MMTKEEVTQVIAYCDENKISYKQRLAELRINPWSFYDAKRKYAADFGDDHPLELTFQAWFPNAAIIVAMPRR